MRILIFLFTVLSFSAYGQSMFHSLISEPEDFSITSVTNPQSVSVVNGTVFASVPLPTTVRGLNSSGYYDDYAVTWSAGSYDETTNGSYAISGTLDTYGNAVTTDVWVLPQPEQWYDAIDSTLNTYGIENLNRVVTKTDAKTGNDIAEHNSTITYRPAWNGDGAYYNGATTMTWGTTSSHNTFHHDTPWTIYVVWYQLSGLSNTHLGPILNSNSGSATNTGISLFVDNRSGSSKSNALLFIVTKGVAGQIPINISSSNNAITQGAWNYAKITFDGTDCKVYANGSLVGSQTPSIAFSVGNASIALKVGNYVSPATAGFKGYLKHVYMHNAFVSGATETLLDSWAVAMASEGIVEEDANVYMMWGQSNLAGRGDNAGIAPDLTGNVGARIVRPLTNFSGITTTTRFEALDISEENQTLSTESPSLYHGMEMRFGKEMWNLNKNCWIVKAGWGGSPVVLTGAYVDWNIAGAENYNRYLSLLTQSVLNMRHVFRKNPIFRGMVIMEGETDAIITGAGAVFKTNTTDIINGFIDHIHTTLSVPVSKLRIYIFRITDVGGAAYDPTEFAGVVNAIEDIGDNYLSDNPSYSGKVLGTIWRTTDDIPLVDAQHYDDDGLDTMGTILFNYFKTYISE